MPQTVLLLRRPWQCDSSSYFAKLKVKFKISFIVLLTVHAVNRPVELLRLFFRHLRRQCPKDDDDCYDNDEEEREELFFASQLFLKFVVVLFLDCMVYRNLSLHLSDDLIVERSNTRWRC